MGKETEMPDAAGEERKSATQATSPRARRGPHDERLDAALDAAELRLTQLERTIVSSTDLERQGLAKDGRRCLDRASEAASAGAYYHAWDALHQFDAEWLRTLDDAGREARWRTLCAEAATKLQGSWRATAAAALIEHVGKTPPSAAAVRELHAHLVAAAQNQQHKLALLGARSERMTILLALVVAAVTAGSAIALMTGMRDAEPWARTLLLAMAAGALGGILSMSFQIFRTDLKGTIPTLRFAWVLSLMRPLLGATVAIPVVVLIQSGVVKFDGVRWPLDVLVFCFLAGFSERWFLGLMERLEADRAKR
jgi:hypothetical protein